jgi:hypothetical protein
MPADVTKAKSFLLNTDFPLDKIIFKTEGSFVINSFDFVDKMIPHGFTFGILPLGTWSTDPNFTTSYDFGSGPLGGSPFAINNGISSDATRILVSTTNNTNAPVTFYYRIYAFLPADKDVVTPSTANQADTFAFSTDYNYSKLFINQIYTQPAGAGGIQNVIHNLGYRPQVLCWQERNGEISPTVVADLGIGIFYCIVTATSIQLTFDSNPNMRIHLRVYLDN